MASNRTVVVGNKEKSNIMKVVETISANRQLYYVTIQLTKKCNFHCKYCYQKPEKNYDDKELSYQQWYKIIDDIYSCGCRIVKFTGGEILCYRDFKKIYEYTWKKGMVIKLFTNGYLITDEIISLFRAMPPHKIRISIYGNNNENYKEFTNIHNGWDVVHTNLERLLACDINASISCVINNDNYSYLNEIYYYAMKHKIKCSFFSFVNPYEDGNTEPLSLQVSADLIRNAFNGFNIWEKYCDLIKTKRNELWKNGYKSCNAGRTSCSIDQLGNVYLCEYEQSMKISLLHYDMNYAWDLLGRERIRRIEGKSKCSSCNKKTICGLCFPVFYHIYKDDELAMSQRCLFGKKMQQFIVKG